MTKKEFELFDAINREGLDNSEWMIFTPLFTSNSRYLGFTTREKCYKMEEGEPYLVIWLKQGMSYPFVSKVIDRYPSDFYEHQPEGDTHVHIYKLN